MGDSRANRTAAQAIRSATASGFFALRSPLLPLDAFVAMGEGLEGASALAADDPSLEASLARDRALTRARLVELVARPDVGEALFVASPSVWEAVPHWLEQPESESGQKVERAILKYVVRMSTRSTPFGLFAGCSVGQIGGATTLTLGPRSAHRRQTRLDGAYVEGMCQALATDPAIRAGLTVRPNSSLYLAAGRWRYAESRLVGGVRTYHLVAVEPGPFLAAALGRAAAGARIDELAAHIVELDREISDAEAVGFIDDLVAAQLLVVDLSPAVTGPDPIAELRAQLAAVPAAAAARTTLAEVEHALGVLDAAGAANPSSAYVAIADRLRELPAPIELPRLFQVDLVKPAHATLSRELAADIARAVELVRRLGVGQPAPALDAFRAAFERRYENREVSLCEVLDEETGIGFDREESPVKEGAPLLEGLPFAGPAEPPHPPGPWRHLARRVERALRRGEPEVVLDQADVEALTARPVRPAPDAFAVMLTIGAPSIEALAAGDHRLYLGRVSGPSGAQLLGRFCQADATLHGEVARHLRAEEAQRPDAVFAEIVHLPEGRTGNVVQRPVLRTHEITLLGRSGAPAERQLLVSDLTVSLRGERIVLRSRRLDREVIPRLTTAHNFAAHGVGVYRFLGALQSQGVGGGRWHLGPLVDFHTLPRVRHGRVVLSLARWRLAADELRGLAHPTAAGRFRAAHALREARRLPRHIVLVEHDNRLAFDLESSLSVDAFVRLARDRSEVELEELAPSPDDAVVTGPDGRYAHELIVPFVSAPEVHERGRVRSRPAAVRAAGAVCRSFLPGSEWLYAKLYTGASTADQVLREVVAPLVARGRERDEVDRWFFVRHADPDPHIRIRLHGPPARLLSAVLPSLHDLSAPLLVDGRIVRIQLDTYEREIERYGGDAGIDLVERLFMADSDAVLAIVELLGGDVGLDAAWRLALLGIDLLWDDLGLDLETRIHTATAARAALGREHGSGRELERALGTRFRRERHALTALMDPLLQITTDLQPGVVILRRRSTAQVSIVAELRAAEAAGLSRTVAEMGRDLAHMFANRLLRSAARTQELVLYDFLGRLYQSRRARGAT